MVYVVILNWNGWRDTLECVESVLAGDYPAIRIIVCDNGSTDESRIQIPRRFGDRIKFIPNAANMGFAAGNNIGMQWALAQPDCRYIWLLNNDTVVAPDALSQLVERMEQDLRMGLCGSTLLYYHQPDRVQAYGGGTYNRWTGLSQNIGEGCESSGPRNQVQVEKQLSYILGASVLLTRDYAEMVGLMSEKYFLFYEELDWAWRRGEAFSIGYAPDSLVFHKRGASTGDAVDPRQRSRTVDYYSLRNRILFTRKFYPYALPTVCAGMLAVLWNRFRRGQGDRWLIICQAMRDGLMNKGGKKDIV